MQNADASRNLYSNQIIDSYFNIHVYIYYTLFISDFFPSGALRQKRGASGQISSKRFFHNVKKPARD